mgnify:CR=1 FL=1
MDKAKYLFLWLDNQQFHAIEAASRGVAVAQIYKQFPMFFRVIRKIQIELNIPWISPWIASWKKHLHEYDTVIIHASKITPPVARFIRRQAPNIRIIVWYWNPVDKCVPLNEFSDCNCEIWSFDEDDCVRYGIKYNTQYYFDNVLLKNEEPELDVFFVGGDKGRIEGLINLQQHWDALGISSYFHITPTGRKKDRYKGVYKKRIDYAEVLDYISKSKAILDYVSEQQSGLTLRPLEALFFRKKLITNDQSIVDRDFYKEQNIFVLGKDDPSTLVRFLNSGYLPIKEEIVNKYDFDSWLNRFATGNAKP